MLLNKTPLAFVFALFIRLFSVTPLVFLVLFAYVKKERFLFVEKCFQVVLI
jgi:hypothetical protein